MENQCPDCDADWSGTTCEENFHQFLFWESEDSSLWEVHHLMVLSYHLQHPRLYSPDMLHGATQMLNDFLEHGVSTEEMRLRLRDKVDSRKRKFKITGTADAHGSYAHPVNWTMRTPDVVAGGMARYVENIRAWAQSIYEALETSGNL